MTRRELLFVPFAALAWAQKARPDIASRRLHLAGPGTVEDLRDARVAAITVDAEQLGGLSRACGQAGIEVVYRYPLAVNPKQAARHPEWLTVGAQNPKLLCLNSPYLDLVVRENRDILAANVVNGAYFDDLVIPPSGCFCHWCTADRKRLGISDIGQFNTIVAKRVETTLARLVQGTVYFNGRPFGVVRDEIDAFSYLEIEAGFAPQIHYLRTLGRECVGVIGQQAGLEASCLERIAAGAKVAVRVVPAELISSETRVAFRKLEALEKWTQDCRAVADIGVVLTSPNADRRVSAILTDLHQQFDLVDARSDFALYKLVVCPDVVSLPAAIMARLEAYVDRGGALLMSGLRLEDQPAFARRIIGVTFRGAAVAGGKPALNEDLFAGISAPFAALREAIKAERGTEILATYGGAPLITKRNSAVYVGTDLFLPTHKAVIRELIRLLMPRPSVIAPNLPETARVTMLEQRTQGNLRRVVHVMHYAADGQPAPLDNVRLSVSLPQHPLGVVLIPSEQPLEFKHNEFYTTFTLGRVLGHQAIAFE